MFDGYPKPESSIRAIKGKSQQFNEFRRHGQKKIGIRERQRSSFASRETFAARDDRHELKNAARRFEHDRNMKELGDDKKLARCATECADSLRCPTPDLFRLYRYHFERFFTLLNRELANNFSR